MLDVQECPAADLAICKAVAAVLQALIDERWTSLAEQQSLAVAPLATILLEAIRDAEATTITNRDYLRQFGIDSDRCTAQDLWRHLLRATNMTHLQPLITILEQGPLSRRITPRHRQRFANHPRSRLPPPLRLPGRRPHV